MAVVLSVIGQYDGKDLEAAKKQLAQLEKQSGTFASKFQAVGKKFQDVGASMSKVGGKLTKSVTLPIVGIGAAAIVSATEFETSMAKITGLVGIAADKVADFREDVLAL
jgi:hypothetical protein